jgi:hypothetical protein
MARQRNFQKYEITVEVVKPSIKIDPLALTEDEAFQRAHNYVRRMKFPKGCMIRLRRGERVEVVDTRQNAGKA